MKILITGGKGQLGSELRQLLNKKECHLGKIDKEYNKVEVINESKEILNITNSKEVENYLENYKPDIVINTAAITNVDECELNPVIAYEVNSLGIRNLAIACEKIKAKLIHISTDYVFNGKREIPYKEFDLPSPINIYGKTKYMGEEHVKKFSTRYMIVRTGWLYGKQGKNFMKTIIKAAHEKEKLEVVDDQIGNPTWVEELAYHILKIALTDEYGIYHCTGKGECSWYEFAKEIIEYAKINCSIIPISSYDLKRAAKRPFYSSLDNMMLRNIVGDNMIYWQDAFKVFMRRNIL